MKNQVTFETTTNMVWGNSFGIIDEEKNVKLEITIGINSDDYGYFELYDIASGGNDWYAEGGLWFDNKTLVDYDGVFELPEQIVNKLDEMGYNVEEFKN